MIRIRTVHGGYVNESGERGCRWQKDRQRRAGGTVGVCSLIVQGVANIAQLDPGGGVIDSNSANATKGSRLGITRNEARMTWYLFDKAEHGREDLLECSEVIQWASTKDRNNIGISRGFLRSRGGRRGSPRRRRSAFVSCLATRCTSLSI